jgi:hypothetical protein
MLLQPTQELTQLAEEAEVLRLVEELVPLEEWAIHSQDLTQDTNTMEKTLPTMDSFNRKFEAENPQYFTSPKPSQVSALSSVSGSKIIGESILEHTQDMGPKPTTTETASPTKGDDVATAMKKINGITAAEANATGANLDDYILDTNSGFFIPKNKTLVGGAESSFKQDEDYVNQTFSNFGQQIDNSTNGLISLYKQLFSGRIKAQEEANRRELEAYKTLNTRLGTSRYAPGVAQGVLTADERVGLDRINKIVLEEASLIAQAEQSRVDKKYSLFVKQRDEIKEIRKEKKAEVEKLLKAAQEEQKKVKEREIQSTRDAVIADLVKQGVKDPAEIMGLLQEQAAAQGTKTDFTADEIEKALKIFSPDADLAGLSPDFRTYNYLKKINDPTVAGLNFLEFQRAITNAKDSTPNSDEKPISLTPEKKTTLLGAGFSQSDVQNIEKDVRQYGLEKVLEGITDEAQKKAIKEVYGVKEKVTRQQLETTVTQKVAYDALKETYTEDELKEFADKDGKSSFWTPKGTDIERWLNSEEARTAYIDLLYKQYEEAGMAE